MPSGPEHIAEIREQSGCWDQLPAIRQNQLMSETMFLRFVRERGIPVGGLASGEPRVFADLGWLSVDGLDIEGAPAFHPFRLLPTHQMLSGYDAKAIRTPIWDSDAYGRQIREVLESTPKGVKVLTQAPYWNRVSDLATLLEPLYWPRITGKSKRSIHLSFEQYREHRSAFESNILDYLRTLDVYQWRQVHEQLLYMSAELDQNPTLYVLLRLSKWRQREALKGSISGALWIRHIAEVIRLGFEAAHEEPWPSEEDECQGHFFDGVRKLIFGAERVFDNPLKTRPFLVQEFGLTKGSSLRWYVEGQTEYAAFRTLVEEPELYGIEIVNLKGQIKEGGGDVTMKLVGMLAEDCMQHRFSMLSLDADVAANKKAVRKHIQEGRLVGSVAWHDPDFERANFSLPELFQIKARLDVSEDAAMQSFEGTDHINQEEPDDLEAWYRHLRKERAFKGEGWGQALAEYAGEHPRMSNGNLRPMIEQVRVARQVWAADYAAHRRNFQLDPDTFRIAPRPKKDTPSSQG